MTSAIGLTLLAATAVVAQEPHDQHQQAHAAHGNPADLEAYIRGLEDPERDEWQRPQRVVAALGLEHGLTVCDIGAGPGYFTLRLTPLVGETGHVFAVDVEPVILDALRKRLAKFGVSNVTPVLAQPDNPLLPKQSCDLILVVDTYHHFPDGPGYLRALSRVLRPGGRLVNIDFRIDAERGPRHRVSRKAFLEQAAAAGYELEREETFLPHQYFLVLRQP
jgi:ubiquinone/menaquinone biosynthesis C-methylase UbiE